MSDQNKPFLNNFAYDIFKFLTELWLPLIAVLYFMADIIWGMPNTKNVLGILVCIILLYGILLSISAKRYYDSNSIYDGQMVVSTDATGKKTISLELNKEPIDLATAKVVSFKVTDTPSVEDYEEVD